MRKTDSAIYPEQYYIDLADKLSALRALKGFVYFLIAAALAFTCVFNFFYGIFFVEGARLKGNENVAVVVNVNKRSFEEGETVLVRNGSGYCCAEFTASDDSENGIYVKSDNGNIFIRNEEIEGKAEFVLFPVSCFGDNTHDLCIGNIEN